MAQPKVIFVDAVGTLFGVKGNVGQIYGEFAQRFGVVTDFAPLNKAFYQAFKAATPMAFPDHDPTTIPGLEYAWWRDIAYQTFSAVDALPQFPDFEQFFTQLYAYFATAEPWIVYGDTRDSLIRWQNRGISLGVLSNFDSRLYSVLEALDLANYFQSITISTEVGAAKPNPLIFKMALEKHNCQPQDAWHVGDSYTEDFEGAKAAGLKAIWLNRHQP